MKISLKFLTLGVFTLGMAALPIRMAAAPGPASGGVKQENMTGKFVVSSVTGKVEITSEDRITTVKKGDIFLARNTSVKTFPDSNCTIVFSNQTSFFVDEKTSFKINKFEQQPFLPNNNLVIEPSNSDTLVTVQLGRVVISTPQLLSGTNLIFETAHAHMSVLNDQSGGEKAFIEVTEKQTHFALVSGAATIQPRGADGDFVSIGTRLKTGEQAYVKYTLTGGITMDATGGASDGSATTAAQGAPAAPGAGAAAAPTASAAPAGFTPETPIVNYPGEAVVLVVTGPAKAQLSDKDDLIPLQVGAKLPQGATIITGEDTEVYLQPFDGAVATIRPNSKVVLEKLSLAKANEVIQKQTALLDLKAGTLVSFIDPAKRNINNYGVRTPKGIATAQGTSFSVSVSENDFSVAATADTVTFVTPGGTNYSIAAGNITITSANGTVQPPIPLAQAVAADPGLARVVQAAVNTVTSVVRNNLGDIPSASAINLISQIVGVAAVALPGQAANFETQAVTAVTAPNSSTAGSAAAAAASVTTAIVTGAPATAAQTAAAGARAAPAQATTVAASAANASPTSAGQVATSVMQTMTQTGSTITAMTQTAATLAAAIAASVPTQAGPVTGALMQMITQANPQASVTATTQAGASLAAAATAAAPAQAAPVATAVMQMITQSNPAVSTGTNLTQTAATLASAITSTAPTQAVPVATALMQFVQTSDPASGAGSAGLIAASVAAAAPGSGDAVNAAVATASGQTTAAVSASAQSSAGAATQIAAGAAASVAAGAAANTASSSATTAVAASTSAAANVIATAGTTSSAGDTGVVKSTSIIVTQLNGGQLAAIAGNLASAQGAQSGASFSPGTDSQTGNPTVIVNPTVPVTLPVDNTVSPANLTNSGT